MVDPLTKTPEGGENDGGVEILMQRFVEGTLDPDHASVLLKFLKNRPEERRRLAWHVDLDSVLREKAAPTANAEATRQADLSEDRRFFDRLIDLAQESPSIPTTAPKRENSQKALPKVVARVLQRKSRRRQLLLGSAAMSLCVFLLIGVYFEWFRRPEGDNSPTYVARIVESIEAVWDDEGEMFKVGREIGPTRLKLKSGVVKLRVGKSVHLVLEGPTELFVKAEDKTFCSAGTLSASVGLRGRGFEIATPLATIVDLGTAFTVGVDDRKTEVHVVSGKVEVTPSSGPTLLLSEGLASAFDLGGRREVPFDSERFLSESRLKALTDDYVARRQPVWDRQFSLQRNDPSIVRHYLPEANGRQAVVSGSRPDRTGVCFNGPEDRRELTLMKRTRDLTLIAYVMPHEMKHASNTLLIGDEFYRSAGEFVWQLDRNGMVQFHVNEDGRGRFERYNSIPVVKRKDWNTWLMLAVVVDGTQKTLTHYLDGRAVTTLPWQEDAELVLNRLSIGDEQPGRKKSNKRFFKGCMEEIWIYSRPFSPEEIERFYNDNL